MHIIIFLRSRLDTYICMYLRKYCLLFCIVHKMSNEINKILIKTTTLKTVTNDALDGNVQFFMLIKYCICVFSNTMIQYHGFFFS